jgi:hypothetical protein
MQRWKEKFPSHSIIFHDDYAVERLFQQEWPEFQGLHSAMKCILFKGAMKIDVWRVLVLWKYGGIYTDIDNWPEDRFTEDIIPKNVSAFFFSDPYNRPSQWFMALEPRHPIMYFTMLTIIENILAMGSLRNPNVVQVTGPGTVKTGYAFLLSNMWQDGNDVIFQNDKTLTGRFGKTVYKLSNGNYRRGEHIYLSMKHGYYDIVPYNETLNVTRQERIEMESGVYHWQKERNYLRKIHALPRISCAAYLNLLNKK